MYKGYHFVLFNWRCLGIKKYDWLAPKADSPELQAFLSLLKETFPVILNQMTTPKLFGRKKTLSELILSEGERRSALKNSRKYVLFNKESGDEIARQG